MALGLIESQYLQDIADALREKLDSDGMFLPSDMAPAIENNLSYPEGTRYLTSDDIQTYINNQTIYVKNNKYLNINFENSKVNLIKSNIKKGASIFGIQGTAPTISSSAGVCDVKIINCLEGYDRHNNYAEIGGGIYVDCTPNHKNYTDSFYLGSDMSMDYLFNPTTVYDLNGNNTGITTYFKTETLLGLSTGSIIVIASTNAEMSAPYTSGGITPVYSYGWSQFFLVSGRGTIVIRD